MRLLGPKSPGRPARALLAALLALAGCEEDGAPTPRVPRDTILRLALDVARRDHPDLDETRVRADIAALAAKYRELAGAAADAAARADAFRKLLFETESFAAVTDLDTARHLHIDTVLADRKGYCLSLSVIALAVAERVGAPLHGVAAPNHFFVRYDDGRYRRNLELTRRGEAVPDLVFAERMGPHGRDSIYLKNLTARQVRAFLLHNRGYVAMQQNRRREARADFEAAIAIVPQLNEAHRNLGVLHGEQKRWPEAKRSFTRALRLYPADVDALINLALCRRALGEHAAARQELEMALVLDPDRERAQALLDEWSREGAEDAKAAAPRAAMPAPPPGLRPGLRGAYFAGTKFNTLVTERIDPEIDFDWKNGRPAAGLPWDRFSIRWEGYLKAPRAGVYIFFVAANDGARLALGETIVLDNWKDMGFRNWYGSKEVRLEAGWHPLRIEHYDRAGGARILLRVGVEGEKAPLVLKDHLFHVGKK